MSNANKKINVHSHLVSGPQIKAIAAERDRLKKINSELLEALEFLLDAVRQNIGGNPPTADQIFAKAGHAAVAAIAKAEGAAA